MEEINKAISHLHDESPTKLVIHSTGAGSTFGGWLYSVENSSKTMIEYNFPYAMRSTISYCGFFPKNFVSNEVAIAFAKNAFERGQLISINQPENIVGIGSTGAIATGRPKKGPHHTICCGYNQEKALLFQIIFVKGKRNRIEEEFIVSLLNLYLVLSISKNCQEQKDKIEKILYSKIEESEYPKKTEIFHKNFIERIIDGDLNIVYFPFQNSKDAEPALLSSKFPSTPLIDSDPVYLVISGSFNPLHSGHLSLIEVAAKKIGKITGKKTEIIFESGIKNVDKKPLSLEELNKRSQQFKEKQIAFAVTNHARFVEKSRIYPSSYFVLGYDTFIRLFDLKYYSNQEEMYSSFLEIAQNGCKFVIGGRFMENEFFSLENHMDQIPLALRIQSEIEPINFFYFPIGVDNPSISLIDEDLGLVYFVDSPQSSNSYLLKFNSTELKYINAIDLGVKNIKCGIIDKINKLAYFGNEGSPNKIVKVDLDTFEVVDTLTLSTNGEGSVTAQIDIVNQKAYFSVNYDTNFSIVKIDLSSFTEEKNLSISVNIAWSSLIDVEKGILYVTTDSVSGDNPTIYKIDLSNFTQNDTLSLQTTLDSNPYSGVIDTLNNFMYIGTYNSSMQIIKINLTDFTRVDSITCNSSQNYTMGAGIDEEKGVAYFLSQSGFLLKINLTTFTIIETISFESLESFSISFDFNTQKGFIGLNDSSITEIDLLSFSQEDQLSLRDYSDPGLILIDEVNQMSYIVFNQNSKLIAKVNLTSFELVDYLPTGISQSIYNGEIDVADGFAYLFFDTLGVRILKLRLSNFSIDGIKDLYTLGSTKLTEFDEVNKILYVNFDNYTYSKISVLKISCPDLEIVDTLVLNGIGLYEIFIDYSTQNLYVKVYELGSGSFIINKISLSNFSVIDSINLQDYYIETWLIDEKHQYIYFGSGVATMNNNNYYNIKRCTMRTNL
ncbi:nicotinamide mononucleotide adenylyltransferase [Anaeramoeba ignava]|uniref:Nicotinamide mononucleotide adenylyltransferase n=1 Tax=Anaeramoeba ignava TaxID=1746090 RepID=A0A9Q0RE61_ANAIG|nr:nicotinamide mononucleotide adenylyltransferase [Anaeramoeba ignava]